jgi:pilus assembly protein Flp/PilA
LRFLGFYGRDSSASSIVTGVDHLKKFLKFLVAFVEDDAGLTMVEYAVAGGLVTSAAVAAFINLGGAIVTKITSMIMAINA